MREVVEKKVLSENDRLAAELRQALPRRRNSVRQFHQLAGLGENGAAGKNTGYVSAEISVAVLTGDLQTDNDARRLARYGFPVRQIVTGGTCHLDARMVERHLNEMGFRGPGLLFVENVGNLVCPSSYDLGEAAKIVLLSVTEGEDKPLKYPGIFHRSSLMILTKTDLLPHVEFDPEARAGKRAEGSSGDRLPWRYPRDGRGFGSVAGLAGARCSRRGAAGRRSRSTDLL